jgi:DNA-binding NtrC family response regulator
MSTAVLVLEDDPALCDAIARIAGRWGDEVLQAHTVARALELLERDPVLLIVDVRLPDGNALEVVEAAARRRPAPAMVAVSGEASPEESFRLAQAGVRAYLAKPIGVEDLTVQIARALQEAPPLEPLVVANVGIRSMRDLKDDVRRAMVDQAIALAEGNRSEAARLLDVSRQAVQQIMQERGGRVRSRQPRKDPPART